jgi:16S rRNA G1207 methylase RsmC
MPVDQGYFKNERPEVAAMVETSAKSILDVGCGYGLLGASLKSADKERRVVGIENFPAAADGARQLLDTVINADIEDRDFPAIE